MYVLQTIKKDQEKQQKGIEKLECRKGPFFLLKKQKRKVIIEAIEHV